MKKKPSKREFLQIRISKADKDAIRREAKSLGIDLSDLVLRRLLSSSSDPFNRLIRSMKALTINQSSFQLAELHDLLTSLPTRDFNDHLQGDEVSSLDPTLASYVAAMVEFEAGKRSIPPPEWTATIQSAPEPYFASSLKNLRLHLLAVSPAAFRRRNLFIDAAPGARV